MNKFLKRALFLLLTVAVVFLNSNAPASAGTTMLTGAGATFPYPLYSKWFNEYNKIKPDIQINYQSIGSGGGIQQIKARTVDFGASDAPLSNDEEKAMPEPVVQIPTTAGMVAVVYNLPGINNGLKLSQDVVADLFLGNIKKWNDPRIVAQNPGIALPDMPVAVIYRSDGSGTTFIFSDYLVKISPDFLAKVGRGKSLNWPTGIGGKGNEGVAGQVKQIPGAVGYVEYAYAVQNKLTFAAIRNKSGQFVEPNPVATVAALSALGGELQKDVRLSVTDAPGAGSYPIVGLTYLILYKSQKDMAKGKTLVEFLKWAMTDGQKQAAALYYSPLPAELVKLNEATIASITVQ
jgi:phosphate transport system substrate-binding protein